MVEAIWLFHLISWFGSYSSYFDLCFLNHVFLRKIILQIILYNMDLNLLKYGS